MAYINKNVSTMAMPSGMNRMGQFPLDMSSVYYDRASLEAYATSGSIAYVGQIVSLVDETNKKVTVYSIQNTEGLLKEVGTIPLGDGSTIEVSADGVISLLGSAEAEAGKLPMLEMVKVVDAEGEPVIDEETGLQKEEKKLVWKTLEQIGAGDGNDNTTYAFAFDATTQKLTITPSFNSVAQAAQEIDLSTFLTAAELPEDKDTTYSVAENEKVLKLTDTVFSTELGLKHENGKISLTGIGGAVIAEFSDADFVKDSVLDDVNYNAETKEIEFTWKTVDGETKTDAVSVADFVQTYEAGNGLELNSNEFAVKVDSESENFLTIGANGVKLSGVQSAIDTAKQGAIDAAASAAAGIYATQSALSGLETALDARLDDLEAYDHGTYATKNELKATDDVAKDAQSRVGIVEGKIDEITSVGGEPNVVEKIKVNGVTLEVEKDAEGKSTKAVNIAVPVKFTDLTDDSGFDGRITTAQNRADEGVTNAAAAQTAAEAAQTIANEAKTQANTNKEAIAGHLTRIIALEDADTAHAAEYSALAGIVSGHTTEIAKKASQTALDKAIEDIAKNSNAIASLNDVTILGINQELAKKANNADVYTKTDIGTIAEGKTLVKMVEEAAAAGTNAANELANGAVKANTEAIAAIYTPTSGEGENLVAASGILVDLVKAEETRAKAAEKANADAIAIINGNDAGKSIRTIAGEEALKIVDGAPEAYNTLKEVADWIANDQSGAASMAANISKNTTAIAAIYSVDAEGKASGTLVTEIARVEGKADANAQAIAAINDTTTGIAAVAKKYTDDNMVKADEASIENKNGTFSVKKVTVDILDATGIELILNAGDSGYKAPEVSE